MSQTPEFSVIVPAYNELESLPELVARIETVFTSGFGAEPKSFELIIIDDGSSDGSADFLEKTKAEKPFLRPIILRTNVGKSMALNIGFKRVKGDYVITLDADLQDNPEDIPALVAKLHEGYDVAGGQRGKKRRDTFIRKIGSKVFNGAVRRASGLDLKDLNCGFKAYRAEVVKTITVYGQFHRYIPLLAHFAGFKVTEVPVKNSDRKYGVSKFPTFRYQGLFDLLTILFLNKYNLSPLHFFAKLSALFMIPSMLVLGYLGLSHLIYVLGFGSEYILVERPLLTISLTSFLVGLFIFLTGFVCDFILHHSLQGRLDKIATTFIKKDGTASDDA